MSNLTKTIKLRIHVTPEQETLFRQMTEQYRQACNFVSRYIFDNQFNMAYQSLNKKLYGDIRSRFGLKSQLTQSSIKTVIARYKTVKQQLFQNPYRYKDENGNWQLSDDVGGFREAPFDAVSTYVVPTYKFPTLVGSS